MNTIYPGYRKQFENELSAKNGIFPILRYSGMRTRYSQSRTTMWTRKESQAYRIHCENR